MTDPILDTDVPTTDHAEGPDQVEVRRNVVLSALVGALAAALAAAFAVRSFGDGSPLDWAAFAVLGVVAVLHAAAVADGRAPLLVADRLGVRLREGADWQGIAWDDVECLEHLPRRLPLHDGHLLVVGESGQQLIVPLTLATRIVGATASTVSDELAVLADGRADVVEVVPGLDDDAETETETDTGTDAGPGDGPVDEESPFEPAWAPEDDTVTLERHGIAAEVERRFRFPLVRPAADDTDTVDTIEPVPADASTDEIVAVADAPGPGRPVVAAARVEVQHTRMPPTAGATALSMQPSADPAPADQTLTVVLDDAAVTPAPDPVIGPQLEAARNRIRLTVDQLSERTRIRPHVIEAIEVDDFGPCGGDFYARGHLRTLARVLGIEAGPLVASYDEKYADAPVDPRRVFESELATGVGGSIRGTRGGRNWSVLLAAVMAAVLVWSVARLVMDGPAELGTPSTLRQTGSGGIGGGGAQQVPEVPVTIVFEEQLAFGQTAKLDVRPPVRIQTSDGSVTAAVDCKDAEPLGETGAEVTKVIAGC